MAMDTLRDLFEDEIKDLYNAESQLLKALPKMAKKAESEMLREAFTSHLEETRGHLERLQKIGEMMDFKLGGKKCHAMEGLVEEGKEVIDEDGNGAVIDAALIGAAQRVEHYEMAGYGVVRSLAQVLGETKVAQLLQQTLDEEGAADKKLTKIATSEVLKAAMSANQEEEAESNV